MKNQYHITIKEDYFRKINRDWPALHPDTRKALKQKIFAELLKQLEQGNHVFTTSDDVSIRQINRPMVRVIRSLPAAFKY